MDTDKTPEDLRKEGIIGYEKGLLVEFKRWLWIARVKARHERRRQKRAREKGEEAGPANCPSCSLSSGRDASKSTAAVQSEDERAAGHVHTVGLHRLDPATESCLVIMYVRSHGYILVALIYKATVRCAERTANPG